MSNQSMLGRNSTKKNQIQNTSSEFSILFQKERKERFQKNAREEYIKKA